MTTSFPSSDVELANSLQLEEPLQETAPKRRRQEEISSVPKELPNTVTIDGYEYLNTQWCALQHVEYQIEHARSGIEEGEKKPLSEEDSNGRTLVNCLRYLIRVMQERGREIKYRIERSLKDRPNLRSKYRFELNRISDMLKKCECEPLELVEEKKQDSVDSDLDE